MRDRRRNLIVLGIVGALALLSLFVILPGGPFEKKTQLGLDLRGGVELIYQAEPTPQVPKVTAQAVTDSINTIRKRTNALGVSESEVQQEGPDTIVVGLPGVKNAARAEEQVGTTAQMQFYDWEPNIIGPDGKQNGENPVDPAAAYQAANTPSPGLLDAVKRAAKAKPLAEANDVPASGIDVQELQQHGIDPKNTQAVRQYYDKKNDTSGKKYYLFNSSDQLLAGPETTCKDLLSDYTDKAPANPRPLDKPATGPCAKELNALGKAGPPAGSKVYVVPQGITIVQAERPANLKNSKISGGYYVLEDDSELTGSDIKDPKQAFDPRTNEPIVTFNFSDKGRKAFARVTKRVAQRGAETILPGATNQEKAQHFAITLDDQIVSRAFIDFIENPEGIDGRTGAQINGIGSIQETQDLAENLRIGALPVRLKLISKTQVSASLGKQALHQGLIAGAVGLALVILFLLIFYRLLGLVAVAGLAFYGLFLFALIKLIPITMTLPGIAGMILTLGVAADANIVIFERIKEEIRHGRSIPAAISNGYQKALRTIIDANVVTIGVAFILFMLASGGVKGFAFTLGVGTIVSLLTAVVFTSALLGVMSSSRILRSKQALGVGDQEHHFWRRFDFMGSSRWFFSMSGVILVAGALAIAGIGVNFGIDFESGSRIKTPLERPASVDQVRTVMDRFGQSDAKIQTVKDPDLGNNVVQISTKTLQPAQVEKIRSALDQQFGVRAADFTSESIGPTFGAQIARTAAIALVASLILISLYIMLRFDVKYSVPVLIALTHDILITGGVYALTQHEVTASTVAALLTILGYSLYDTIIVFDRIRENAPRMPRATFSQIVNRSMSEVLARSLVTSFCTLLPVMALLIFGGQTLKDFAFALLIGIASGTYSSIFIASPVLTEWKEREPLYRRRRQLVAEDHDGVVPAYASTQIGEEEEVGADGQRKRTGRRVIADRPGRPARSTRKPAPQRMAGPIAPEIEHPDAAVGAPHVMEPDEIEPDEVEVDVEHDEELAEDSAEVTNGSNGAPEGDDAAEARRAERRRQQRAKRRHGRR